MAETAETHEVVTKVWIAPGCIVCDACENDCPEVFDVTETTCLIRPPAMAPEFLSPLTPSIKIAAEGCPVDVIKYETKVVPGPAPWPKEGEGVPAGAGAACPPAAGAAAAAAASRPAHGAGPATSTVSNLITSTGQPSAATMTEGVSGLRKSALIAGGRMRQVVSVTSNTSGQSFSHASQTMHPGAIQTLVTT